MRDKSIHIILIEDNKIFRFVFSTLLQSYTNQDIHITEFENGLDILLALEEQEINLKADFLFIDLNMPYISGWELLDRLTPYLQNQLGNPKIYIISSSVSKLDKENLKNYPFVNGYISKPFTKEYLFRLLDQELSA